MNAKTPMPSAPNAMPYTSPRINSPEIPVNMA